MLPQTIFWVVAAVSAFDVKDLRSMNVRHQPAKVGENVLLDLGRGVKTWRRVGLRNEDIEEFMIYCGRNTKREPRCQTFVDRNNKTFYPPTKGRVFKNGTLLIKSLKTHDFGLYSSPEQKQPLKVVNSSDERNVTEKWYIYLYNEDEDFYPDFPEEYPEGLDPYTAPPPIIPQEPLEPSTSVVPSVPVESSTPVVPSKPVEPSQPVESSTPVVPSKPVEPSQPVQPCKPFVPCKFLWPCLPLVPLQPLAPLNPFNSSVPIVFNIFFSFNLGTLLNGLAE